jgi:hypothetical protein
VSNGCGDSRECSGCRCSDQSVSSGNGEISNSADNGSDHSAEYPSKFAWKGRKKSTLTGRRINSNTWWQNLGQSEHKISSYSPLTLRVSVWRRGFFNNVRANKRRARIPEIMQLPRIIYEVTPHQITSKRFKHLQTPKRLLSWKRSPDLFGCLNFLCFVFRADIRHYILQLPKAMWM